jgi:hypothetical protein
LNTHGRAAPRPDKAPSKAARTCFVIVDNDNLKVPTAIVPNGHTDLPRAAEVRAEPAKAGREPSVTIRLQEEPITHLKSGGRVSQTCN